MAGSETAQPHELVERARSTAPNSPPKFVRNQSPRTGNNGSTRAKAVVKAGQPDVYANNLIERAWKRWQKRENCTVSRRHTYAQTREQRLTMCARDGDVFIRLVPRKESTSSIRHSVHLRGVGRSLAQPEPARCNGYIKMGIEYDQWGAVAAYYIIKRKPATGNRASFGRRFLQRAEDTSGSMRAT
jgi:capsid protein